MNLLKLYLFGVEVLVREPWWELSSWWGLNSWWELKSWLGPTTSSYRQSRSWPPSTRQGPPSTTWREHSTLLCDRLMRQSPRPCVIIGLCWRKPTTSTHLRLGQMWGIWKSSSSSNRSCPKPLHNTLRWRRTSAQRWGTRSPSMSTFVGQKNMRAYSTNVPRSRSHPWSRWPPWRGQSTRTRHARTIRSSATSIATRHGWTGTRTWWLKSTRDLRIFNWRVPTIRWTRQLCLSWDNQARTHSLDHSKRATDHNQGKLMTMCIPCNTLHISGEDDPEFGEIPAETENTGTEEQVWRRKRLIDNEIYKILLHPVANAKKLLQACIYRLVNTGLFLTSLVATCIVKFMMLMLDSWSIWYLTVKTSINKCN